MLADARRVRLALGTRLLLAGGTALLVLAAAVTWAWIRQARAALDDRPRREALALAAEVAAALRAELRAPMPELGAAVHAARAAREAALAVPLTERQRRRWEAPALDEVVRAELQASGLSAAWLREPGVGLSWSWHGGPLAAGAEALDGACVASLPGVERELARCAEVALAEASADEVDRGGGAPPLLAGGLRRLDVGEPAGAWALYLVGHDGLPWRAGRGWPGLDASAGLAALARGAPERWLRLVTPAGPVRVRAAPVAGLPLHLVVAVPESEPLPWRELAGGRAGALTAEWHRFLAGLGAALAAGLLLLVLLAVRLRRILAPLVESVARVGREALPQGLPLERTDEIGVVAAGLADLGTSLRATRQALDRAARAAAWRDVGRALAHELKNPLLPLRGTVENLLRWRREEPERFDRLFEARAATLLAEIDHLARLADTLGQLSRLPEPRPQRGDLETLARDVARLHLEGRAGVELDDRLSGALADCWFDRVQARQLVANLVRNALEALGEGPGRLTLRSGTAADGSRWLAVEDDGEGAEAGDLERLFRPGYTTRADRGGQGVGLFLCRRIAMEHGGRLEAQRGAERGLRLTLTLPPASEAG